MTLQKLQQDFQTIMTDWKQSNVVKSEQVMVVGCSTSEIAGETIGSSGSTEIAEVLYTQLKAFQQEMGVDVAYQCCEHLNRAIVMERALQQKLGIDEVSAVPHPAAGGSMAAYAYGKLDDPVLVEHVKADLGMDIGDTLIGMHLKHVAVPLRFSKKSLGDAHVTFAYTRPKLIGGNRAIYQ
ncbi:TIGR01440 family protein [Alkalibacillus haloalkaliphilus]|uniref:TIGR01440 family protein n=1 Tax=Alkalibacillus haloalkaliphilus TaxID=94136 RepID=UPI0029353607|nr:TIGR01440 family protein [Alkalibacillus haloalkaliphilus]MDV2583105.1 TIGR01440 family protein [Alkalibacillus haloalkaliphilus]